MNTGKLLDYLDKKNIYARLSNGNIEYDNNDVLIIESWEDHDKAKKLFDWIESNEDQIGLFWVFSDEWDVCPECYAAFRTQADSYHWKPSYHWISDYELVCTDCLQDYIDEYIESFINGHRKALDYNIYERFILDTRFTLTKITNKFYNGLHNGMNDDPETILKKYMDENPRSGYIFCYNPSQFYVEFELYEVEEDDIE